MSANARLPAPTSAPTRAAFGWNGRIVGIGASAGAGEALMEIVSRLPADGPPVMIVQHIPEAFVRSLADRLDRSSPAQVRVAEAGARLTPGRVYLAPSDRHLVLRRGRGAAGWCCGLSIAGPVNGFRPSVDVLFASMTALGGQAVGVILSGMGRDGAAGLLQMRQAGGATLGQDAASSVVYGMPKAAMEAGAVERQGPPTRIAAQMLRVCRDAIRENR